MFVHDHSNRLNITQDERDTIAKQQKDFDRMVKSRQRHMIMAFEIKRKLREVYKRELILSDVFESVSGLDKMIKA